MWKTSQRRNRLSQSWILQAHSFEAVLSFILETKKATELYDFQCFKEFFVHFKIVFKAYSYYFSLQKEDEHFLFQSYAVDQEKTDTMILCPQENSQICYLHLIKKNQIKCLSNSGRERLLSFHLNVYTNIVILRKIESGKCHRSSNSTYVLRKR